MSTNVPNENTILEFSENGTVWNELGGVTAITPPGTELTEVERTKLRSTIKEFRAGRIVDVGVLEFTFFRDPNDAGHQDMADIDIDPGKIYHWRITYPDAFTTHAKDVFQGWVKSYQPAEIGEEGDQEGSVTVRLTTKVTRTPGS